MVVVDGQVYGKCWHCGRADLPAREDGRGGVECWRCVEELRGWRPPEPGRPAAPTRWMLMFWIGPEGP